MNTDNGNNNIEILKNIQNQCQVSPMIITELCAVMVSANDADAAGQALGSPRPYSAAGGNQIQNYTDRDQEEVEWAGSLVSADHERRECDPCNPSALK